LNVLLKLVHTILDEHPAWPVSEIRAEAKDRAGESHLSYNVDSIDRAVDMALAQRSEKVGA